MAHGTTGLKRLDGLVAGWSFSGRMQDLHRVLAISTYRGFYFGRVLGCCGSFQCGRLL